MSSLEFAVRPTMGGLVNDIAMTLDEEQQRLLAQWATKTAMVIEGVKQAKNGFYSRSAFPVPTDRPVAPQTAVQIP